jgi:hypothetical protein
MVLVSGCLQAQNPGIITPTNLSPSETPTVPASGFSAAKYCAHPILAYGFPGDWKNASRIARIVLEDCRVQRILEHGGEIMQFGYELPPSEKGDLHPCAGPGLTIRYLGVSTFFIADEERGTVCGTITDVSTYHSVPPEVESLLDRSCETSKVSATYRTPREVPAANASRLSTIDFCVNPILVYGYHYQWDGRNASRIAEIALEDCRVQGMLEDGGKIVQLFRFEAGKGTRDNPEPAGPGMRIQYHEYMADFIVNEKLGKVIGVINVTSYPSVPVELLSRLNQSCVTG